MNRNGTPTEDTAIPDPVQDVDTGKLSTQFHDQMRNAGNAPAVDVAGVPTPDEFLDALATKLAAKAGVNGNGGNGNGHRTFLRLDGREWTKMLIAWSVGILVFMIGWQLTIRDGLRDRPTTVQVEEKLTKTIAAALAVHTALPHPDTRAEIQSLRGEQVRIRESQIRQETLDGEQTRVLDEIKQEIRRLRTQQRDR